MVLEKQPSAANEHSFPGMLCFALSCFKVVPCTAYLERAATGFLWPCANKAHARCNHIDKLAYATIFARSPKCSDVGFIFKGLNSLTFFQSHDQSTQDFCER
ncbi:hypothetical protein AK812_SmicGene39260 [Symbiodinium microadriaticum]|uniref:Uncharacterized protein n=1 Tax=Symbiodinium microadriaticum TaxID=2951 RepID=A0A1Q9CBM0_SYMMI|nr:hypothetical protein AK812_SmicGene39260 [Symbiodinium microadriaticum]